MRKYFCFFCCIFLWTLCNSQSLDSLSGLIKEIQRGQNDSIRLATNQVFREKFENVLHQPGSFTRNYDSLKNISVQSSDDNKFRLYTWVVPHYEGEVYEYFGYIQIHTETSDTLIALIDSSSTISKPESEKLTAQRWLGSVYYSIIPVIKSEKTYYTLLGWKAKNKTTTQKIIDILYFNGNQVKFGFPLLKNGNVFHNRMIFSFNSQATMTLHYNRTFKGIVFDHVTGNKKDGSMANGPDGTYDAFKFNKGRWVLYSDVDVRSKWEPSENLPEPPIEK